MKAIVYHKYGPPDVLSLEEIEKPTPGPNEVLIRVRTASVNPYDWHFMRGIPHPIRILTGISKPKSPRLGRDVAGEVESVGAAVTRFKPGDKVFGGATGAFAEYACAKETEITTKPPCMPFEFAAAIPIAGITALQALRDKANLQPGQEILINGASGGVGTFAVQIARIMGARATAVSSARNAAMLLEIGASRVIDYAQEDFAHTDQRWDVLFDLVGNRSFRDLRLALHEKGILVGCGGGGPETGMAEIFGAVFGRMLAAPFVSQRVTSVLAKINSDDLNQLAEWMAARKLAPVLDPTFPLAETPAAIRHVETGHARGKVTIAVA